MAESQKGDKENKIKNKIKDWLKKISRFEKISKIIMSIVLFLLPIFNIAINNWFSGLKQCLFFINIIALSIIAIALLITTYNHKDEEALDFWLNNDLKGFIYKFFTTLLTLSSIVYTDISNAKKPKDAVNFFIHNWDIKIFEIFSLIIMVVIIGFSLRFYSSLEKSKKEPNQLKKETKRLNKIFAIDLFVFIEYLAALLAIKEIKILGSDIWSGFSVFFIFLFAFLLYIFFKNLKQKEPAATKEPKDQSEPAATKEPKDRSEPAATKEPKGQSEPAATKEPKGQSEPAATKEPKDRSEPAATKEPKDRSEPAATKEPKDRSEPAATKEPKGQSEPAATKEPKDRSEPAATKEPKGQSEPAATKEPKDQSEPAATKEPKGQSEPAATEEPKDRSEPAATEEPKDQSESEATERV